MILGKGVGGIGAAPGLPTSQERLRQAAHEFEALFLAQLFREMRASIPSDPTEAPADAREMFTAMLDDAVAVEAARRSTRGLGEALYRQLSARLDHGS
jgi:flagellar protein FlgJ